MKREKDQLEAFFRDELRLSVADAPSFEDLAAFVEGRLDPEARALLEERIANDPALAQEVEDLRALHGQMARPRAAPLRRPMYLAALAAAAAVAAVALILWRHPVESTPPTPVADSPSPPIVAALKDGDLSSLEPAMRETVTAALRGALPAPHGLESLSSGGSALMGAETAAAFAPLSPLGTRVSTDRPTFRWASHPGARRYEVGVFDTDLRKQVASGPVAGLEWTPVRALPRGATYLWQVTADVGGGRVTVPAPPSPEARFAVAGTDVLAEVAGRRAQAPASHLVAAMAFIDAGLLDDAEAELQALAAANPGSSQVARLREALIAMRPARSKDPR